MSVFSDERIQRAAQSFVPAADEVWRLQRGGDSECQLFQRAINGGELITDNGTRQGVYVMPGAGRLLSRGNSLKADRVLGILERGLAAWDALPTEERTPRASGAQTAAEERWERSRPADGLVLPRVVRDLPPEGNVDGERPRRWNRDALWFSKDEVRALVDAVRARPDGAPVPDGEPGRLRVAGGSTALCYWGDKDKSNATFQGAWCTTADIMRRDAEGVFWYVGRGADLLKVSGIRESPLEIENVLLQHPLVRECCVVGRPDEQGLVKAHGIVVCAPHALGDQGLADERKAHCKERLAPHKYPRSFEWWDRPLPRNDRGKIARKLLK